MVGCCIGLPQGSCMLDLDGRTADCSLRIGEGTGRKRVKILENERDENREERIYRE